MESTFNLGCNLKKWDLDVSVSKADCEAKHIAGGILQRVQRRILRSNLKHHAAEAGGILQREQRLILRSKLKHHAAEAGGIA